VPEELAQAEFAQETGLGLRELEQKKREPERKCVFPTKAAAYFAAYPRDL